MLVLLAFSGHSQNYRLIDLKNPAFDPPDLNYYILDIIDSRELQSSIGMVKAGDEQELVMLEFTSGFYNELNNFFSNAYSAGEGKNPILLNFTKLWVTEYEKDGATYSRCEVGIEFLTPKKQKFFECTEKNEMELNTNKDAHKDNITVSINSCMHYLTDPEMQQNYYEVLNSSAAAISVVDQPQPSQQKEIIPQEDTGSKYYLDQTNAGIYSPSQSRLALHGGFSYRIAKIPEDASQEFEEHYNRLKTGYNIGSDITFFWNPENSFGASINYSQAKSTLSDVAITDLDGSIIAYGDIEENVKLFYIGPTYLSRHIRPSGKTHWLAGMTVGYYNFNEDMTFLGEAVQINGGTVGFGVSLGVDILTTENFAFGIQTSALLGWLNKVKVDGEEVELEESENLSRIDISFGFRILP
jgi:hypothetical protein